MANHTRDFRTWMEASYKRHVLGNFSPTTQTYECLKCGLRVAAMSKPSLPECPGYVTVPTSER